jgi:hypothetical protein
MHYDLVQGPGARIADLKQRRGTLHQVEPRVVAAPRLGLVDVQSNGLVALGLDFEAFW